MTVKIIGHATAPPRSRGLSNDLAPILVQPTKDAGDVELTATAEGLKPATAVVHTRP